MNRLFPEPAVTQKSESSVASVEQAVIRNLGRSGQPYSLFAPLHYEPNYAYPLVVWLHNDGGDERQLARVMPLVSMRNYVGLGVRGRRRRAGEPGYCWPQTSGAIMAAERRTSYAIAWARQKYNLHDQRVFLAGYEAGGTMAFRLALRNPQRFAGALSIGGSFPEGEQPLARLLALRKFPLFLAHCRDSQTYPIERVCDELRLIHSAGLAVTLRQYPCADELTTVMLHDMDVWMMERVTGIASSQPADAASETARWN